MSNPLVSVVIDNYNYDQFLGQAIDSVLNQTYGNIELIVVDDGSRDDSKEIIQSYGDKLIPIFQENSGQLAAINTGFSRASGKYVCFLDSDDYYHIEKVEKIVKAFEDHPNWVQISHPWISVDQGGKKRGVSASNRMSYGNVSNLLLRTGRYASGITSSLAYKRDVLERIFPIPLIKGENTYVGYIDSFLNTTVPFYGEVGCVNEALMFYRIHGNNGHAHSGDIQKMIREREFYADFINDAAATTGHSERFDVQQDPDFRAYKAIEKGSSSLQEKFLVPILSLRESFLIGRTFKDSGIRLFFRGFCTFFPSRGMSLLTLGIRSYFFSNKGTWLKTG